MNQMRRLRDEGKTIVLVTHDLMAVTGYCSRAILLDGGRNVCQGSPELVVQRYHALMAERQKDLGHISTTKSMSSESSLPVVRSIPYIQNRYGEGGAEIIGIVLLSSTGEVLNSLPSGIPCHLLISVLFKKNMENPIIGFTVRDRLVNEITSSNTSYEETHLPYARKHQIFTVGFHLSLPSLRPGSYSISPAVSQGDIWNHIVEDWIDNAYIFNLLDTGLVYGQMRWSVDVDFQISNESKPESEEG